MIEEEDLKPGQPRLLSVDNEIVVSVNKVVKVLITANDVLHAWALPSFGVKKTLFLDELMKLGLKQIELVLFMVSVLSCVELNMLSCQLLLMWFRRRIMING